MKKLLLLSLFSISIFACKKDKNGGGSPETIEGYWIGTWKRGSSNNNNEMAVVLRNNGSARILYGYNGSDTASAIYVTEDQFSYNAGRIKFESRESNYIYIYEGNVSGNKMNGTWGTSPSFNDGGTWTMTKQK